MFAVEDLGLRLTTDQDFYEERLSNDYREARFWELAKQEGMSYGKFERHMQDKKVILPCLKLTSGWNGSGFVCQVPCTFSFIYVHPKKGLTEDAVGLTCFNCLVIAEVSQLCGRSNARRTWTS